jgi:uncharacterized membrane protein
MTTDQNLELAVGRVLGFGIMASSVCLGLGMLMTLAGAANAPAHLLLTAGLVLLMATPAARVVVSVVDYARERDWVFVTLTVIVLCELLLSVLTAIYGFKF